MSVVVESRLECVPLAGILVRTFCSNSGFSEVESGQIEVCVMEAANNCVVHAYQREPGRPVEVVASRTDGAIQFEVWDEGRPMDPELLTLNRSHLLELNQAAIEGAPESGRGLAIIEAIMDGIGYSTSGGRNRFWMTKRVACESVTT
jgi:serine/threonine-protein kinase RsbW